MRIGPGTSRPLIARAALSLVLLTLLPGASAASVTGRSGAAGQSAITAVVVKSWGNCSGNSLIWDSLNSSWPNYGDIPLSIDYSYPGLCASDDTVTLAELEATGANVVIISDPAGGAALYSEDEAQALIQYENEGHDVIGTFLTLGYNGRDNRVLAPLFGLTSSEPYDIGPVTITPTYKERNPSLPLFRDVGDPYVSAGFADTELPADGAWSTNELTTGKLAGRTSDSQAVIILQRSQTYDSLYIASMPEYAGGAIDEQFFYNAIVYLATR